MQRNHLSFIKVYIMIEVKRIPLSKLFKAEVGMLLQGVIQILEKYDYEVLRLKDFHELLVLQLDKAKVLLEIHGVQPLTPELTDLHKKRLKYAALINMQLRSLENVECKETLVMVKHAQLLSKKFLAYLGQKRLRVVESQIGVFFSHLELEDNAAVAAAYVGLGLQPYLDEMEKTNKLFIEVYNQRAQELKDRPKTSDRALEKETVKLMLQFLDQVNSYQRLFKDIDYSPFISELNEKLTAFSKLLKTRIATNKRRARKKALTEKLAADAKDATEAKTKLEIVMQATETVDAKEMDGGVEPEGGEGEENVGAN